MVCFFKQKTAYEMRISDWSSDVGSSDLLHRDNDTVRIEVERETRLRVPLHHLGGIVSFGDVLISPALIGRCAESGIGMTLLDRNGRFRARIEGPVSGHVLLRNAQPDASSDTQGALVQNGRASCRENRWK